MSSMFLIMIMWLAVGAGRFRVLGEVYRTSSFGNSCPDSHQNMTPKLQTHQLESARSYRLLEMRCALVTISSGDRNRDSKCRPAAVEAKCGDGNARVYAPFPDNSRHQPRLAFMFIQQETLFHQRN